MDNLPMDMGESDDEAPADSNGKKHVCPTCHKRFNRPSSLRIHVNTHTGATRKLVHLPRPYMLTSYN